MYSGATGTSHTATSPTYRPHRINTLSQPQHWIPAVHHAPPHDLTTQKTNQPAPQTHPPEQSHFRLHSGATGTSHTATSPTYRPHRINTLSQPQHWIPAVRHAPPHDLTTQMTIRSATQTGPAEQGHFRLYSRIVSVPNTAVSATDAISVQVMAPPSQAPDIIERTAVTRWLIGLAETPAWSQPGMVDGST
ncbi:hypothetical protein SAMN05421854_1052 [Amycolatopsis rubida]|uniref:Uncharacterized protein n=1 Tax=Amycolatopsis rubida TaxID=112413 RepID=A0A1I5PKM1_9PSEU|nr:hypothetical protein SAMN05421854_1052 [Amycolatopsis rubida]